MALYKKVRRGPGDMEVNMFYKRIITAVIGAPVVMTLVYLGGLFFATLVWLLALLGIREYIKLFRPASRFYVYYGYAGVTALLFSMFTGNLLLIFGVVTALFLGSSLSLLFNFDELPVAEITNMFWGVMYVGMLGFLVMIREIDEIMGMEWGGMAMTVFIFMVTWFNDSFAYFVGRQWGTKKLFPVISPNKSLQGYVGGLVFSIIGGLLLSVPIQEAFPYPVGITIVLIIMIVIIGQLGDLLESAIKRKLETKDSGGLLPGHGGILDRFDSIISVAPIIYFTIMLLEAIL